MDIEQAIKDQQDAKERKIIDTLLQRSTLTEEDTTTVKYFKLDTPVDIEGNRPNQQVRVFSIKVERSTYADDPSHVDYSASGYAQELKKDGTLDARQSKHWVYLPSAIAQRLLEG